jgi:hypothetical protein
MPRGYRDGPDWKQIKARQRERAASAAVPDHAQYQPGDIVAFTKDKVVAFGGFLGPAFLIYEYHKARGEHIMSFEGERRLNRRRRSTDRLFETAVLLDDYRRYKVYLRVSDREVYEYGRVELLDSVV